MKFSCRSLLSQRVPVCHLLPFPTSSVGQPPGFSLALFLLLRCCGGFLALPTTFLCANLTLNSIRIYYTHKNKMINYRKTKIKFEEPPRSLYAE